MKSTLRYALALLLALAGFSAAACGTGPTVSAAAVEAARDDDPPPPPGDDPPPPPPADTTTRSGGGLGSGT